MIVINPAVEPKVSVLTQLSSRRRGQWDHLIPLLPTNRTDAGYLIMTPKTIYLPIRLNL